MITRSEAQAIILNLAEKHVPDGSTEKLVISFCELSPNQDYWIIRVNSQHDAIKNKLEHQSVGINAHLVNTQTGQIEIVSSAECVEDYLQNHYDLQIAGDHVYVLVPSFNKEDKKAVINLRQQLQCSYSDIMLILAKENQKWLTGKKLTLQHIQLLFNQVNIKTDIILIKKVGKAILVDDTVWLLEQAKELLVKYLHLTKIS